MIMIKNDEIPYKIYEKIYDVNNFSILYVKNKNIVEKICKNKNVSLMMLLINKLCK
jgi:hypothetical protein